jgi:adenylate kinase family enzyme
LSCPHIELDALHWQPNWVPRARAEFRALTAQALSQDCWVTDGNYGVVRDLVWSRATTVIWLNYALRLVLWRALARTVRRVLTREELSAVSLCSAATLFVVKDVLQSVKHLP